MWIAGYFEKYQVDAMHVIYACSDEIAVVLGAYRSEFQF